MTAIIHLPELFWPEPDVPVVVSPELFSLTVLSPELPKFTVIRHGITPVQYH